MDPAWESGGVGGHRQTNMVLSVFGSSNQTGTGHQFIWIGLKRVAAVRKSRSPRPLQVARPKDCRGVPLHLRRGTHFLQGEP